MKFSKDLDDLWSQKDEDKNGWLDQNEAEEFVKEVSLVIEEERAKNFDLKKFP